MCPMNTAQRGLQKRSGGFEAGFAVRLAAQTSV